MNTNKIGTLLLGDRLTLNRPFEIESDLLILQKAESLALQKLQNLASSPDFSAKMKVAFGEGIDVTELQAAWAAGDFSAIPKIEVRSRSQINGANGAYARAIDTIYVSQEFLNQNAGNVDAIASVILEEIGHGIDARLNPSDSLGDEGAIFSALVRGETLTVRELAALRAEDDSAVITLDGQEINIEQQLDNLSSSIFIADAAAPTLFGGVLSIDPVTGEQKIVTSAGNFVSPFGIAIDANGNLIVTDPNAFGIPGVGGPGGIVRVDPQTGTQTIVSSSGIFSGPIGIVIDANGNIIVADSTQNDGFNGGLGGIIKVNPLTGDQTLISSEGSFVAPVGIAIDTNGDLIVADYEAFGGSGGIIRVNPITGVQSTISSGGSFVDPYGIAIDTNGDLIVVDLNAFGGSGGIIRVNPITGVQSTISSGGSFIEPLGIAIDANGDLIVTDFGSFLGTGSIIRVEPTTGTQTTISTGGILVDPIGVAISRNDLTVPTEGDDTLFGTPGNDTIDGLGGNDQIFGLGGNDSLDGNLGNDTIDPGLGIDTVNGGDGNDLLKVDYSSLSTDISSTNSGNSGTISTLGNSINYSNIERMNLSGGSGNDTIFGTSGNDTIFGNAGRDYLVGNDGDDSIDGGANDDTLDGGSGNNTLNGGAGDDTFNIIGTGTAIGGEGNDIFILSGPYTGSIDGGGGSDLIEFTGTFSGSFVGIETVVGQGSGGNDFLIGGDGNDSLDGQGGNDTLEARGGNDTLIGGTGDDLLKPGLGIDTVDGGAGIDLLEVDYSSLSTPVSVSFSNGTGSVSTTDNQVNFTNIERLNLKTGSSNDTLNGTANNDTLVAGDGNDSLLGNAGSDSLDGGAGNDTLVGANPNNTNPGLAEIDTLAGGTGSDLFILGDASWLAYDDRNSSTDGTGDYATITNFNSTEGDLIQLQGPKSNYLLEISGSDTRLSLDKSGSEPDELVAIIEGVTNLNLDANYFVFVQPTNTPPTTSNQTLTTDEDTNLVFSASNFNFSDVDAGDSLQAVRVDTLPTEGILYLDTNNNGTVNAGEALTQGSLVTIEAINASQFKFKPDANENGTPYANFTFSVSDGNSFSTAPATMTLNITPVNDSPVAPNDAVTTNEDTVLNGNVLANNGSGADSDVDGDTLTITQVLNSTANLDTQITLASGALLTVNANGT
jgi:Ca2+-binding RTX toxin-like protein